MPWSNLSNGWTAQARGDGRVTIALLQGGATNEEIFIASDIEALARLQEESQKLYRARPLSRRLADAGITDAATIGAVRAVVTQMVRDQGYSTAVKVE